MLFTKAEFMFRNFFFSPTPSAASSARRYTFSYRFLLLLLSALALLSPLMIITRNINSYPNKKKLHHSTSRLFSTLCDPSYNRSWIGRAGRRRTQMLTFSIELDVNGALQTRSSAVYAREARMHGPATPNQPVASERWMEYAVLLSPFFVSCLGVWRLVG